MKEMSDLICGKAAVGGNYNSTHDKYRHRQGKSTPGYDTGGSERLCETAF